MLLGIWTLYRCTLLIYQKCNLFQQAKHITSTTAHCCSLYCSTGVHWTKNDGPPRRASMATAPCSCWLLGHAWTAFRTKLCGKKFPSSAPRCVREASNAQLVWRDPSTMVDADGW